MYVKDKEEHISSRQGTILCYRWAAHVSVRPYARSSMSFSSSSGSGSLSKSTGSCISISVCFRLHCGREGVHIIRQHIPSQLRGMLSKPMTPRRLLHSSLRLARLVKETGVLARTYVPAPSAGLPSRSISFSWAASSKDCPSGTATVFSEPSFSSKNDTWMLHGMPNPSPMVLVAQVSSEYCDLFLPGTRLVR